MVQLNSTLTTSSFVPAWQAIPLMGRAAWVAADLIDLVAQTHTREYSLIRVSYRQFRNNLSSYLDEVGEGGVPLVVTHRGGSNVVLMSEDDHTGFLKTVHILKSSTNAVRLLRSIKEVDQAGQ